MDRTRIFLALCAVAALALAGSAGVSSGASVQRVATPVVPSLEPEATEALWRKLVRQPRHQRAQGECRRLRGVFYAATDWLRLATKLAATASPCAEYYVSIPPIVGNKTNLRPGQAERIRALGQNFHALAEFHWTTWSRWVTDNATTWYAAGVEMRRRMAQAGFDVAAGDTWAVNEFPSTVRSGSGTARDNARELVRGLYEGDTAAGTRPTKGAVFIVGLGQATTNVSVYQTNLQNWLADLAFWTDMNAYVGDWSQEVYGDFRRYAVPGAPITLRRDYLNDYLEHTLVLTRAGPPTIELARGYLQNAFSPVANAAWQYESGYGWTMVPFDQMQAFVSSQVYALRSASVALGLAQDHWGFAWQPAQRDRAVDRRLQHADELDPRPAGSGDSRLWDCQSHRSRERCLRAARPERLVRRRSHRRAVQRELEGVAHVVRIGPRLLDTASDPRCRPALGAGQPGPADERGAPQPTTTPVTILLASGSPDGRFSLSPSGPWASAINVTIPVGGTSAQPFYYLDTHAGRAQIRATAANVTTATQIETVGPGPPSALLIDPGSVRLAPRRSKGFTVTAEDVFGNPVAVRPRWVVTPTVLATVKPVVGAATTVTAGGRGGRGTLRAIVSAQVFATATFFVTSGPIRVSSIRYSKRPSVVRVTASVVEAAGKPARGVRTSVIVRRNGRAVFSASKRTDAAGKTTYLVPRAAGCLTTKVTGATGPGYRWNGSTPTNRSCV